MRDLEIRITGDNSSAKAALRDTESAIGGVTKAAASMGSDVDSAGGKAASAFGGVSKAIGLAVGAGAALAGIKFAAFFVDATEKAYALSGVLSDLSDKTGLSVGFLQDLKFAGDQVGVPLETSARAVQTLEQRVVNGGKSIERALDGLGLSISSLRQETPDAMFTTIADAIAGIEDPSKRTAIAIDLMGRSGAQLVPLLANFEDARQGAAHLSDDAVKGFDAIGDAISRWKNNSVANIGDFVGRLTSVRGALTDVADIIGSFAHLNGKSLVDWLYVGSDATTSIEGVAKSLLKLHDNALEVVPPLKSAKDAQAEFDQLYGDSEKTIRAAIKADEDHAKAIQALADTYTGKDLARKVGDITDAYKLAEKQGRLTAYQTDQLGKQLLDLGEKGARIPAVLHPIWEHAATLSLNSKLATDGVRGLNNALKEFPSYGLQAIPTFDTLINKSGSLNDFLRKELGPAIKELPAPPPDPWQAWHDSVKNMLDGPNGLVANMGTTIGSLTHGWDDFCGNLKNTALNTFDAIVDGLVHQFLDPMLAKIIGSQSAFGQAISGLFTGASAGGGSIVPSGTGTVLHGLTAPGTTTTAAGGTNAVGTFLSNYVAPAYAVLEFGNLLNGTGLFGQNSFDSRDRDAMIAQLGLGQYGYQYSTDQLQAMIDSGQIPSMATGGYVPARQGGTLARLAEAGEGEFVVPESKMGGVTINVTIQAGASVVDERSLRQFSDRLLPQLAYSLRRERLA
jgi:hypothetical protein